MFWTNLLLTEVFKNIFDYIVYILYICMSVRFMYPFIRDSLVRCRFEDPTQPQEHFSAVVWSHTVSSSVEYFISFSPAWSLVCLIDLAGQREAQEAKWRTICPTITTINRRGRKNTWELWNSFTLIHQFRRVWLPLIWNRSGTVWVPTSVGLFLIFSFISVCYVSFQ